MAIYYDTVYNSPGKSSYLDAKVGRYMARNCKLLISLRVNGSTVDTRSLGNIVHELWTNLCTRTRMTLAELVCGGESGLRQILVRPIKLIMLGYILTQCNV